MMLKLVQDKNLEDMLLLNVNKLWFFLGLLFGSTLLTAQQDPIYSQLSYNILQFNPAYAGSRDAISGIATYRTQWTNVEGNPKTFNLGVHAPLNNHIGIGANFAYDQIGVSKHLMSNLMAAYRINFEKSFLQFGMQAGLETLNSNYSSIQTTSAQDPSFLEDQNIALFNLGAGAFYSSEKLYLGLSLPTLIGHKNYFESNGSEQKRYQHLYGLVGYVQKLDDRFTLRPSIVTRLSSGTTLFADINMTVIWNDVVWAGVSYKTSNVMALMAQVHLKQNVFIGYSYDFGLSSSNLLKSPTHEIIVGMDVFSGNRRFASPRYF